MSFGIATLRAVVHAGDNTSRDASLTKGTIIQIFYHGLDIPTQEILDAGGIFLYNTPNEAFKILEAKGDVAFIEEDGIEPIPAMPNPSLINSNSPTVSPSLKDCTVHIPYMNAKTFADDVLPNHVGDKELKSIDSVGTKRMTKKDDMRLPKEPNKNESRTKKRFLVKKIFITIYGTQLKFRI
ncbi:hypothetical protein Tco_0691966 [Tanacetum coccineum]